MASRVRGSAPGTPAMTPVVEFAVRWRCAPTPLLLHPCSSARRPTAAHVFSVFFRFQIPRQYNARTHYFIATHNQPLPQPVTISAHSRYFLACTCVCIISYYSKTTQRFTEIRVHGICDRTLLAAVDGCLRCTVALLPVYHIYIYYMLLRSIRPRTLTKMT